MAKLLCGDIEQHIFTARIVFADGLGEVTAGCRELSLRAAELLQQQVSQTRIRSGDSNGVLQAFVVNKHGFSLQVGTHSHLPTR